MTKNFGPAVLGYLDPSGRNFETVVFQAGKAVTPEELNLVQERQATGLSGWVRPSSGPGHAPWFVASTTADELRTTAMTAIVSGWVLQVVNSGIVSGNIIGLAPAPIGAGSKRTDLVILEVWRRLLAPAPSAIGKSFVGRIWANGNVRVSAADDMVVNYPDDILDANVNLETTKRVQIQYRLRAISGVDVFSYPNGIDDPAVVANSVPAAPATPDGVPTLFAYSRSVSDLGLWVAGDGNPNNSLGTVDGYMYAIPLCGVFRRNQTAFDRNTNHNGGVADPGPSDRPDGLFYDILNSEDVADLRGCLGSNSDFELLQQWAGALLDNEVRTSYLSTTSVGGGSAGHTVLYADEIGISNVNGGDGITTGDTPGAEFIGEFDAVRRRFSDRAVYEVVTAVLSPGAWNDGDIVTVDPTNLTVYPYTAFNWAAYNSADVRIVDVVDARWVGSSPPKKSVENALDYTYYVSGLGSNPLGSVSMRFNSIAGLGLTNENLHVDLLVAYPPGLGLSKTPTQDFGAASVVVNNPGQLPALPPVDFDVFDFGFDYPHREVRLQYEALDQTITIQSSDVTAPAASFRLPERSSKYNNVLVNGLPIVGITAIDAAGREITFLNPVDYTSPGDTISITYTPVRPLPQNDEQLTIYYYARAPQTIPSGLLGLSVTVVPEALAQAPTVILAGTGSQIEGYPYPVASTQVGGVYPTSMNTFDGEHELVSTGILDIPGFAAAVGQGQVSTVVPCVSTPSGWTFQRALVDVDAEGRSFFKSTPPGYSPSFFGVGLAAPTRHREVLPTVVSLTTTTPFGCTGQKFLLLLVRDAVFDSSVRAGFNSDLTQNRTTAALIRIPGNPIE